MGSKALDKMRTRATNAARSRAEKKKSEKSEMGTVGGGLLLGLYDKSGWDLPSLPYVPDSVTYGIAAVAASGYVGGTAGNTVRAMGIGMLTCAARELASGKIKLGGETVGADADLDDETISV